MTKRQIQQDQFIESAIFNSQALAEGNSKSANKHAAVLNRILEKIKHGAIDRDILVELLTHYKVSVAGLAAIDLLRINYSIKEAEETLEKIEKMESGELPIEEQLAIVATKLQYNRWKSTGSLLG